VGIPQKNLWGKNENLKRMKKYAGHIAPMTKTASYLGLYNPALLHFQL
jgi:hypothetical protein